MSKFSEFYNKATTDKELEVKYLAILKNHNANLTNPFDFSNLTDAVILDLIPIAKQYGYDFTVAEIKEYFFKNPANSDELSDDELEVVAGGKGFINAEGIGGGKGDHHSTTPDSLTVTCISGVSSSEPVTINL